MEDWSEIHIGELGVVITGSTPPTKNPEYYGDEFPFITPTDMDEETRLIECERFLSSLGAEYMNSRMVPPDSICFVCIGATIGKTCMTQETSYTNQQINSIVVDAEKHDSYFIYYLLNYEKDRIKKMAGGTASPIINKTAFSSVRLKVPNKDIQYYIGRILSAYDKLIEKNRHRIQLLEEMAKTLYQEWFVHFRFPGHEDVEMVDSDLGEIPEGWEIRPFSDIADFLNGYAFKPRHWQKEGKLIVKIAEMKKGIGGSSSFYHGDDIPERYHIDTGNLLFAWSASLYITFWTGGPALLNQHIFDVIPRDDFFKDFMYHSLSDSMDRFRRLTQGATMTHIRRSALDEVCIAVPPPDIRNQFDSVVGKLGKLSINLEIQNRTLGKMRDLLLPKLVSGQINVSDVEIEIPTDNHQTSKYSEQSSLDQRLDGDDEHDPS